jgi:hypothetical protein
MSIFLNNFYGINRNTIYKTYIKKEGMVKIEWNILTPLCIADRYHGKHIYPCRGAEVMIDGAYQRSLHRREGCGAHRE